MESVFQAINGIFSFVTPVSNFLWDVPSNFAFYKNIPLLGNFSLAIIVLLGSGIYFSVRLGFVQIREFKRGVKLLTGKQRAKTGITPLAAFLLSTAMRVGPGNIIGVTGAIAVGGPGALFWMWLSAFFGMGLAFMEGTLAQIFKEKKGDEFVGGLPFYGRKILKNSAAAGVFLSALYILYALCCLPAQGFNVVSSFGTLAQIATGTEIAGSSAFYYIVGAAVVVLTAVIVFGGIRKVTKWTDKIVPVMAGLYILAAVILAVLNIGGIPAFFVSVFQGAFQPEAVFGGAFGIALVQGVKRGLMSNEAGQGTITMPAAAADAAHPCEQGIITCLGVFIDTIVICTLSGFIVIMAQCWLGEGGEAWLMLDSLPKFNASVAQLTPGTALNSVMMFLVTLCFNLFAFTCLLGMVNFSEIAANRISTAKSFINGIRIVCIAVAAFGILCNIAGLELGNLWAFSDLGNILIVYFNVPLVYLGSKYVFRAYEHYKKQDGTPFTSETVGRNDLAFWDERAKELAAGKK